jgi:hypothetical protein
MTDQLYLLVTERQFASRLGVAVLAEARQLRNVSASEEVSRNRGGLPHRSVERFFRKMSATQFR